jgi:membrane-bound lytic murein transglycosylase A
MLLALCALAAVVSAQPGVSTSTIQVPALRLVAETDLPDFNETFKTKKDLIKAANKGLAYFEGYTGPKFIRVADRDYGVGQLQASLLELIKIAKTSTTPEGFNALIRETFDVFQSVGNDGKGTVVFSSYYQPLLAASRKKAAPYLYPLYKRPADMLVVDLAAFGKSNGADALIGRVGKDKRVVPYFTRDEIDSHKALAGKGLEVAWLKDKFDVLDIHIQGSGILKFPDGKEMLAKFAATNAQPFNSVGQMLIKAGTFTKEEINRDKIRQYFKDHPEGADWILSANPRFTFFDLVALPADGEPFGGTNQSLVPSRSVACDPAVMPLGALLFFTTVSPQADKDGKVLGKFPNARFAVCLDTGGAIKGPGRIDIYVGHGKQATAMAPLQWDDGKLYLLVKKVPPRDR